MQENVFNIWIGKTMTKYRKNLLNGKDMSLLVRNVTPRVH